MGDRYIPRRADSVDGDARAFLQMESSYADSAGKEVSMLNLSMAPEELAERQEEHKNNLVATMMDRKAIHRQTKFTALAAGSQNTG
jgi:hypothetical protein